MVGSTFNSWDVMAGFIHFISDDVQANVDVFFLRKSMIACCISSESKAPTRTTFLLSESSIATSRISSL